METIYYNGDFITMKDQDDSIEALLVKDGMIVYAGSKEKAESLAENPNYYDLEGYTMMPSFIDPHGHITMQASYSAFCNLSHCTNFSEITETLKAFDHGQNEIIGYGYDHNFLKEQTHPNKDVLDSVCTDRPIVILHTSGHMCVVNSFILKEKNLESQPDPEGGHYGRDEKGELTGYLEEIPAMMSVLMDVFGNAQKQFPHLMNKAQDIYLEHGITTCQDGATSYDGFKGLAYLSQMGLLKIDVVSYVMAADFKRTLEDYKDYNKRYIHRLKLGGMKMVLDGSPQGKSAWLSKPYENSGDYCGYPAFKDEQVETWVKEGVDTHQQILAHCNGDAAGDQFIRSYKKTECEEDLRPVMIHCQTARDDQLDEMVKIHMIPSIFVAHTYYWGDIHLKNLGLERGRRVSPVKSALERGLKYNFHQDPPVVEPDMLHTIWCAVNRKTRLGKDIGPEQCIDVYDALKGVTINAAYAYFEEDTKGTLEAGKKADLVILDKNPLKVDKMSIKDIQVLETIKEGVSLYKKPITQ